MADTKWKLHTKQNIGSYDIVPAAARKMSELLTQMSPSDLAQAVPYISIWEVDSQGRQIKKLSTDLFAPPKFGESMSMKFGERPDVSIEKASIKFTMAQGWIMFRELDLQITVHKPAAVFKNEQGSFMESILNFQSEHVIYYGWSGGSSVLTSGLPSNYTDTQLAKSAPLTDQSPQRGRGFAEPPPIEPIDERLVMPVKGALKFKVVNYNFTITPDMQVKYTIKAIEDGELASRDAVIMNNSNILNIFNDPKLTIEDADKVFEMISQYFNDQIKSLAIVRQIEIGKKDDPKGVQKIDEQFVKVEDIFNVFFAEPLILAAQHTGHSDVRLHLGLFNQRCPPTVAAFGGIDYSDKSVGEFLIPLKMITDLIARNITKNSSVSAYAIMRQILALMSGPQTWDTKPSDDKMIPELILRTRFNPDFQFALFQVMDRKYYIANSNIDIKPTETKRDVFNKLKQARIPQLSLMSKLSYIKDLKFEVINDEQMKSIFIQKQITKTRAEIAQGNPKNSQLVGGMPGNAMMYRSAIKGTVTLLGNFVFDPFSMLWVDFEIPAYDGLFYVIGRTDDISADGFFTTLTLQAVGNPVSGIYGGVPSRIRWQTAGGVRSMFDWVKTMLVDAPNQRILDAAAAQFANQYPYTTAPAAPTTTGNEWIRKPDPNNIYDLGVAKVPPPPRRR